MTGHSTRRHSSVVQQQSPIAHHSDSMKPTNQVGWVGDVRLARSVLSHEAARADAHLVAASGRFDPCIWQRKCRGEEKKGCGDVGEWRELRTPVVPLGETKNANRRDLDSPIAWRPTRLFHDDDVWDDGS
jgi:hypothetical protein